MRMVLVFLLFYAHASVAQTVDPASPQTVVDALQTMGYRARLDTDSNGDPRIRTAIDGSDYSIWFYGCSENQDCDSLNLSSGWDLSNGTSFEVVNSWNRTKLIGRAYLDNESDPFLDYFIQAEGGLPYDLFEDVIQGWGTAVSEFKKAIDW